jgi:peptidoglycan/LPS O-acetylase OafA/YrhL
MAKLRYRPDVDGLRAVAVAGVMLFHLGVPHIGGGFFGVDVFFVISGYLITSLLFVEFAARGRIDFANFWARRTRRILPSALLVIAVTLVAASFVVSDLALFYAARDAIYAALYIINWQQLAQSLNYFDDRVGNGLFLHYWSLAIEEQFYVFLALVFAIAIGSWRFLLKSRVTTAKPILIGLLIVSAVASFIAMLASEPPVAFFGTHAGIWELSLGARLAGTKRVDTGPNHALPYGMVRSRGHRRRLPWL